MTSPAPWYSILWTLLDKELRSEWRSKELFSTLLVFGVLVLLVFNFAFPPGVRNMAVLSPGILWSSFVFSSILGLNRSLAKEKDDGCLQGMLLTPADRGLLFLGKWLANLIFLVGMELLLSCVFVAFFDVDLWSHALPYARVVLLGSIGFTAVGTLLAAMAVQTRYQEVMLPILLLPMAAPILIGTVKATAAVLGTPDPAVLSFWTRFLLTFDGVFLIVSFLGFEYVVQE